ncbi:MAG TPA: hypothetical protein EYQ20_00365 [candidate division Zixibacteria bacterium]|nr:hypothetical protein [candidate division Zixibacteria bacterium]
MFLKVLSLFEDFFIDLVAVDRGVSMVSDETMDKCCEIVNRLRSLPGEGAVYFTPKAKKILSGWVDAHHKELRNTPDPTRSRILNLRVL